MCPAHDFWWASKSDLRNLPLITIIIVGGNMLIQWHEFPMKRTFSILNVHIVRVLEYVRSDKESWNVVRLALWHSFTLDFNMYSGGYLTSVGAIIAASRLNSLTTKHFQNKICITWWYQPSQKFAVMCMTCRRNLNAVQHPLYPQPHISMT